MTTRHACFLLILSAVAVVASGCSSGSNNGSNPGPTDAHAGAGGSTGGGGATGAGGSTGAGGATTADAAAVAACVNIADDLIADFATDNGLHSADGRSGGFYVYGDVKGVFDPPKDGDNPYPIDTATGNTNCSGPGSFHVKASGFSAWGAAAAADFVPADGTYKGTYDASKYKGISFWAKATAPLYGVLVSIKDVYTEAAANPTALDPAIFPCQYVYAGATNNCSPYLVKFGDTQFPNYMALQVDTTWKRFDVLFADTQQDMYNAGFHTDANQLDTKHLTGMAIQVNAKYSAAGVASANDFELWIDDVNFIE